ncbi:MAG TPA: histidine phosphatase family protein [Chloroflexia bacterium]|jgi:probable phosphoglycerate mutase
MAERLTNLYLIRHGESVLAHSYHIRDIMTEDQLTPEGIGQAERLRDRLAATGEIRADVLLASTFPRAMQTAEIIAPALGLPVVPDDDLQEMRPGDNGGMYWDEYVEQRGRPDHIREPFHRMTPTAENWGQFMLRVATTLHRIAHEHEGKTVVLVCHGGVVDGSLIGLLGLGTFYRPAFTLDTDNTAITHWQHFEQDGVPRWQLVKYNDALHLRYNITTS